VASGGAPQAWDSTVAPGSGEARRVSITTSLATTAQGQELQLTAPDGFLADPATVFPVTIDPPATLTRSAFAYLDSAFPSQTYYNDGWDSLGEHVGTFNGGGSVNRAMFTFPASGMLGKHIISAHLNTTENYSWSCTASQVDVRHSNPWGAGVTWNNQPALGQVWATASVAHGASGSCPAAAVGFDVTSMVTALVSGGWSTYYVSLLAHNETDNNRWKKFANNPTITITYNSYPGTPAGRSVSGCSFVCSAPVMTKDNTPTLTGNTGGWREPAV
jgi:hypothetical protein